MTDINIFEQASRMKIQFKSNRGNLLMDDLWDLPIKSNNPEKTTLLTIANDLVQTIENAEKTKDLNALGLDIVTGPKKPTPAEIGLKVVRHIAKVKTDEADARAKEQEIKQYKQKIMDIIVRKKDASLEEMDIEKLETLLKGM